MKEVVALRPGDEIRAYGGKNVWRVAIVDAMRNRVYATRRNASGKQILATAWFDADEIEIASS